MSKILFCISNALATNNSYYITCFYDQFITALAENGNNVLVYVPNLFHTRTFASENTLKDNIDEDKLRKDIEDFDPDLVISFNGSNYRKIFDCVSCPVLLYDADNYSLWNQKDFIKRNKEKYTFFSFSEYGRAEIKQAFSLKDEQIFYVPAATNLKNVKTEQTANISFIGSFFQINSNDLRNFIENNCGKKALFSVLNEIRQNPFVSSRTILEKYGSTFDDDMKEEFRKTDEKSFTFLFSGQNRIAALYELCDMGLELYSNKDWNTITPYFPDIAACLNSRLIYSAEHNQEIYNRSKLCLNVVHSQSVNSMPWRVMDIMATNGCLMSERLPMIDKLFGKYVKIPMFETTHDVRALAQKLLKDDKWRADVVAGSNLAIEDGYRFEHRFKQMEQIFGVSLIDKTKRGSFSVLSPSFKAIAPSLKKAFSLKNKIRYKIWKHLNKKLKKKNICR